MDDIWGEELEKGDLMCFTREGWDHLFKLRHVDRRSTLPWRLMELNAKPRDGAPHIRCRQLNRTTGEYYHISFIQKVTREPS